MTNITISDDFDLAKIAASGQCFRVQNISDGIYRFITGDHILYISPSDAENTYTISCDDAEWDNIWRPYFDLGRDYSSIRASVHTDDLFMTKAASFGRGIRILHQDAWEMLISFIISQRKSIPSIRHSVEMLSEKYGVPHDTPYETIYSFPTVDQLSRATAAELSDCKLGYRVPYIIDAIAQVSSHSTDLDDLYSFDDETLLSSLKNVKGVGDKVANCIALFAYGRIALAPVDTWIHKVIDDEYAGVNPFPGYGSVAGIMQQYAFFYAQGRRGEKSDAGEA